MIGHVTLKTALPVTALAFYRSILGPLGFAEETQDDGTVSFRSADGFSVRLRPEAGAERSEQQDGVTINLACLPSQAAAIDEALGSTAVPPSPMSLAIQSATAPSAEIRTYVDPEGRRIELTVRETRSPWTD